jgi:hypothetical protein
MVPRSRWASILSAGVFLLLTDAASATPAPLPPSARLIHRGDFVGYRPEPATHAFETAKAWVTAGPHLTVAQTAAEIARLHREGFVVVVTQFLDRGSARQSGLSWVMQLGSAKSARAELKVDLAENKTQTRAYGGTFSTFPVPAVPGAQGYRVSGGGSVGENVFFADGPFLYLVGQGFSSADKNPPTRAGLIVAVQRLYARVHGHPAA